jgi:hypothetical protein
MAGSTEERTKPIIDRVPAAGADQTSGSGTRTIVTTMPEVREASLKVAKSAQRLLSIFTQDLEPLIYGEEPFLEAIKRLVLARSYAKVRVLLADPVRAIGRLVLDRGVPPRIEVDDVVGGGQVDAGAARLERQQEHVGLAGLERGDPLRALRRRGLAVEVQRRVTGLVERLADQREVRGELAEHQRAVALAAQLVE